MAGRKNPPKPKPPFELAWTFQDGSKVKQEFSEVIFQYLSETASMYRSGSRELQAIGRRRLQELADQLGKEENRKLWRSIDNRENSQQPRPNARAAGTEDGEVELEFARLCREGHSAREARGIMLSWGKWSQSTIYRRTKEKK